MPRRLPVPPHFLSPTDYLSFCPGANARNFST